MQLIKLENVSFHYLPEKDILSNISFSLDDTGLVVILGKSGSGKSTLLSLLNNSLLPTSGKIKMIDNLKISTSFQSSLLLDYLNVKENVALPLYLKDESESQIDIKVNEALSQVDLLDKKDREIKNLSGGEKMRVSIARALVNNSNIIILDEPTGALDEVITKEIYSLLKKLSKERLIVLVTHDEEGAREIADTLYELNEGKLDLIFNKEIERGNDKELAKENNKRLSYKKGMFLNFKYLLKHKLRVILCLAFLSLSFSFQYLGMNIYFNIDKTLTSLLDKFYASSAGYLNRVEQVETSTSLKLEKVSLPTRKDLEELGIKKVRNSLDYFVPQYQEVHLNNISSECHFIPVLEEDKRKLLFGDGIVSSLSIVVNSLFVETFKIKENSLGQEIYFNNQVIVQDEKEEESDLCNIELTFSINGISKEASSFSEPIIYYSYDGIYQHLNKIKCEKISSIYNRDITIKEMLDTYSSVSCDINSRAYLINSNELFKLKEKIVSESLKIKLNSKVIEIYDSTKELVESITRIVLVYLVLFIILSSLLLFLSVFSLYEQNIRMLALVKVFSNNKINNFIITITNGIIFFIANYGLFFVLSLLLTLIGNLIFSSSNLPMFIKGFDFGSIFSITILLLLITGFTTVLARQKIKDKKIKKELDGED